MGGEGGARGGASKAKSVISTSPKGNVGTKDICSSHTKGVARPDFVLSESRRLTRHNLRGGWEGGRKERKKKNALPPMPPGI